MAKLLLHLRLRRRAISPPLLSQLHINLFSSSCGPDEAQPMISNEHKERWLKLPPFTGSVDPSTVGKEMMKARSKSDSTETSTTILKWVRRCFPGVPLNLLQKLFRLRQVRRQVTGSSGGTQDEQAQKPKRVSAKDIINRGDVILLPSSVQESLPEEEDCSLDENEINYIRSLELYKDSAIIVVNKPHGLPVQGGDRIKTSMDILAAASLRYDYKDPPRLVHRLDRDTSGILILGRTAASTSILHSIFREKTFGASTDISKPQRILQRKYWALVIGTPTRPRGVISAPLTKVVENGKSEKLGISRSLTSRSSQIAITEYQVIGPSRHGLTWLELCPLTGRKHQLRVHCAEALGTPIVGDFKYGWAAHKKLDPLQCPTAEESKELSEHNIPFGLGFKGGSICDKKPCLHLHSRQMILPNISLAEKVLESSGCDFSQLGSLDLVAPLPRHMQRSWDILNH